MAHIIIRLEGQNTQDIAFELRARELSLILADIGTDGTDNYGIYNRKLIVPDSAITVLPEDADPPGDGDFIASGPLVIDGETATYSAYRVPA